MKENLKVEKRKNTLLETFDPLILFLDDSDSQKLRGKMGSLIHPLGH